MVIESGTVEFNAIFGIYITIIIIKGCIALYLGQGIFRRWKESGVIRYNFGVSMFVFVVLMLSSRILFTTWDFYLTQFDKTRYVAKIWTWKVAAVLAMIGTCQIVYVVDKQVLHNRFRGVPSYLGIAISILTLAYPVETLTDFGVLSIFPIIVGALAAIVPFVFIFAGKRTPELRKIEWIIAAGMIVFMLGSLWVSEIVLAPSEASFGTGAQVFFYALSMSMKVVGLSLLAWGTLHFKV